MHWWLEFKRQHKVGYSFDLPIERKVPPAFLFFKITDKIQGSLHISELNWNFGLCQADFKNITVGSIIRVFIIGFDDKYKKVHLTRKLLPTLEKPSVSTAWIDIVLRKEISAVVFEEFKNKVVIQLDSGLFATIPLIDDKKYKIGSKIQVIPIRKNVDQNIIECTLREVASSAGEQSASVIETFKAHSSDNAFSTSESYLSSYLELSQSIYWNYFGKEEQELIKTLFENTENLFSKVETGEEAIYIEFDFDSSAYYDFVKNIAPAIFDINKLPKNSTEKDLLIELSNLSFWYTQFDIPRKVEGTDQTILEKLFSLFNEIVSIRGIVTDEGSLKIRNIKTKIKTESLKEKQFALKKNNILFINRPLIFSQFAPVNTYNKSFILTVDNKLTAFKLFEVAKSMSLDILQKEGKEFKIFSNFLESQIDFEVKSANETELQIKDCKLILDIQTDGITFTGSYKGEHEVKIDDKVVISNRTEEGRPQSIGSGTINSIQDGLMKIKSNVGNIDFLKNDCFIKKITSTKQHVVQIEILNKFFANKLPLDTFYKIFHDKEGIEPPQYAEVNFFNEIFINKDNPQTRAVKKAVGNKNILLIQGPPGTGKTTVITEIVKQLITRGEKLLVTSQTHVAVDNVLERIKDDVKINIARVGHQDTISDFAAEHLFDEARKKFSEKVQKIVDIKIELINHHVQGKNVYEFTRQSFDIPISFDWQIIEEFISLLINYDLDQATLLVNTLEQWKIVIAKTPMLLTDLFMRNLNVLFGTCIGLATCKELTASDIIFDTVILDEAGKANISETLTAISRARKIILVGDHKQLPPYLDRDRIEYFKKFSKEITEQKTTDHEIKQALGVSFFEYLQRDGVLHSDNKILLSEQHRMHPDIGNFVSKSFYDSELINGEHTKGNVIPMAEPFTKQIIFIDTSSDKGSSESFKDGSYYNQVEAEFIVNRIIPELGLNNISSKSFAVVSPYSKQSERVRELLLEKDNHAFNSVEVATLDSFQGRELDIIIFSFTRSAIDKKVGFLDDARRLNVAFSRAKKKLILIGNIETLTSCRSHADPYYTNLFINLRKHAIKYGKLYKINDLDFRRLQTEYKVGEIVKAKVKRFENYGVVVNLGNRTGLITKNELSWTFGQNPTDILCLKQDIDLKIIEIDEKGIRLSLKQLTEKPTPITLKSRPQIKKKQNESNIDLFKKEVKVSDEVVAIITQIIKDSDSLLKVSIEMKYKIKGIFYTSIENNRIKTGRIVKVIISKIDSEKQQVECNLKT